MTEEKKTTASERPLDCVVRLCYTCAAWGGDKQKAKSMAATNPVSMSMEDGWPDDASCGKSYKWASLEIRGDAVAYLEVPASFGCILWEPNEKGNAP